VRATGIIILLFISLSGFGQIQNKLEEYSSASGGEKANAGCELADLYLDNKDYSNAIKYSKEALKLAGDSGIPQLELKASISLSEGYEGVGQTAKAISQYQTTASLSKKYNQAGSRAYALESIGVLGYKAKDYKSSISGYQGIIDCQCATKKKVASAYEGIALANYKIGNTQKAISNYASAYTAYDKVNNAKSAIKCKIQEATLLANYGDNDKAISILNELKKYASKNNQSSGLIDIENLIKAIDENQLAKDNSITEFDENVRKDELSHIDNLEFENVKSLAEIGQLSVENQVVELRLYAEMQAHEKDQALFKMESENKQRRLDSAQLQLSLQTAETEKANAETAQFKAEAEKLSWQLTAVIGILMLMVLLVFVIIRTNRKLKGKNLIIENQNNELENKNKALDDSNVLLAAKNKHITDSINYASKIQGALLANNSTLSSAFTDHFVYNSPRDIVSGDFSWVDDTKEDCILVVADCTGHGVPGALITVLAVAQLEKIVRQHEVRDPQKILAELNNDLYTLFKKSSKSISDGMDISIVSFNKATKSLSYAGSRKGLILMKGESEDDLIEIKGSIKHLGNQLDHTEFNQTTLQLEEGDTFYMFSDGYYDQKGGPKGKKFYPKKFKAMLLENKDLKMVEQHKILEDTMDEWSKGMERIDDILIVGVRA